MDYDLAYANGAFIAGADDFPPRWQRDAEQFRSTFGARAQLGLIYGPAERNRFDLFLPDSKPKGLLVFIHGGYWLAFGRETWSHLAAGAVARGWAVAMPSYTLAPLARVAQITAEIAGAVMAAAAHVAGPVVVTGHSAGGHLAARMACADIALSAVRRVVPISPLADLAPLLQTKMNEHLRLTPTEVSAESPAHLQLRPTCAAHIWVGGQERPSFLWQARLLSENWNCPWTVAQSLHHFSVINDLCDPNSALIETCLNGL